MNRRHLAPASVEAPVDAAPTPAVALDRVTAIAAIRTALRQRSGKAWSVRGGNGTAWGWITITAPPRRCDEHGCMSAQDCDELGDLLGLGHSVHPQGVQIAASHAHRVEYVARARGCTPIAVAKPYWD